MRAFIAAFIMALGCASATAETLEQFGGGANVADNTAAWNAAMSSLAASNGGTLTLTCASYKLASNVAVPSYVAVVGCGGDGATIIDCSPVSTAGACITATGYGIRIAGVFISGANGPGLKVSSAAFIEIDDVNIVDTRAVDASPWNDSCLVINSAWMVSIRDARLVGCRTFGLEATGYNTTLQVERLYVDTPKKSGIFLNGVTYSSFSTTASDNAGDYGYWLKNCASVTFVSPGAESAAKGMFLVTASDSEAVGAVVPDVTGLVIIAPFSFNNGLAAAYYTSLLEVSSSNGRKVDISIVGGSEFTSPNSRSMSLSGLGVRVSMTGGDLRGTVATSNGAVFADVF